MGNCIISRSPGAIKEVNITPERVQTVTALQSAINTYINNHLYSEGVPITFNCSEAPFGGLGCGGGLDHGATTDYYYGFAFDSVGHVYSLTCGGDYTGSKLVASRIDYGFENTGTITLDNNWGGIISARKYPGVAGLVCINGYLNPKPATNPVICRVNESFAGNLNFPGLSGGAIPIIATSDSGALIRLDFNNVSNNWYLQTNHYGDQNIGNIYINSFYLAAI